MRERWGMGCWLTSRVTVSSLLLILKYGDSSWTTREMELCDGGLRREWSRRIDEIYYVDA